MDLSNLEISSLVPTPGVGVGHSSVGPLMLSGDELAAVESDGDRLRSELVRLMQALPPESRSVRTMAALLSVDRNTCQRVIAATQPSSGGCEAFLRLPGLKPLWELISRAREYGVAQDVVEAVSAAVERHAQVLQGFDQSHQRLKGRIEATLATGVTRADRSELGMRRLLFEEHARLLRRRMRTQSLITAIRPKDDDPDKLEQAWIRGLVDLRVEPGAMPVPLGISSTSDDVRGPGGGGGATFGPLRRPTGVGQRVSGLVAELSTSPAPTLTGRHSAGTQVMVVDPSAWEQAMPIDLAIATRIRDVERPNNIYHTSAAMYTPAERLVFDVFLHRSLAQSSVPACGVFQFTMSFSGNMDENWPFRMPGQYRMELLGLGLRDAASQAWNRHAAAAEYLFEQAGWLADEFVGHRMDIEFPLWGSTAYQWFDFRTPGIADR